MKLSKSVNMDIGFSQVDRARSRDPKSAFFIILQNRDHYHLFATMKFQKWGVKNTSLTKLKSL